MCSIQDFETVLRNLTVPDTASVARSEQFLTQAKTNPDWLIAALLELAQRSQDPVVQHMSVVLLRRYVSRTADSLYQNLSKDAQTKLRHELLLLVGKSPNTVLRKGVAHCVAALGIRLLDPMEWPELFPALFSLINSGSADEKETAMLIMGTLAPHFPDELLASTYTTLCEMCAHGLKQPELRIQATTIETAMAFVTYITAKPQLEAFRALLPLMMQSIGQALTSGDAIIANRGVEAFVSVAEVAPEFFNKHLKDIFVPFLQVANTDTLDDNLRRMMMEFTITVAENDPKTVKKVPAYLQTIVPLAMKLMLKVDCDAEWNTTPAEDDDDETDFDVGMEALDRLAISLGGKLMHPIASPLIVQFASNSDWHYRHAGLIALSQITEGCQKEFAPVLSQIAPMIAKFFEDPHERVRYAAITAMAQCCTDFVPDFQTQFHQVFMPLIVRLMADPSPRVAALSAQSCINFLEGVDSELTNPYMDGLLMALLQLLQHSKHRFVSESVVVAISAIAEHIETLFVKYYDTIVPWLKNVIGQGQITKADRMLRAKALDCISRVALAVGKDRFLGDAPVVLETMRQMQIGGMEADDPQAHYLLRAWGRMAEVLGKDFVPCLEVVMPPLMKAMSAQTDVIIVDEEGQEKEEGVESVTLSLKGLGDKRLCVKTSEIEEKTIAAAVFAQVLEATYESMLPHLQQLVDISVPLLKFIYVEELRELAAKMMPLFLKCLNAHVTANSQPLDGIRQLLHHILSSLLDAIKLEPNPEVKSAQIHALGACLEACPPNLLTDNLLQLICNTAKKCLTDALQARRTATTKRRGGKKDDDDEEDEEAEAELEAAEECACQSVDTFTILLKTDGPLFQPQFEKSYFPMFADWLSNAHGSFENRLGLCVIASYLEYHGAGAAQHHIPNMAKALLAFCDAQKAEPDVVQVACYGLGMGCLVTPQAFHPFVPEAVQRLMTVVQTHAKDEEWESCVCNAVSALLKAFEHHSTHPSGCCAAEQLLPFIVAALPVKGDEVEGPLTHRKIVGLFESHGAMMFARSGGNPQEAMRGLCRKLVDTKDFVDEETLNRVRTLVSC